MLLTDFYCKVATLQLLQLKIKKSCGFYFGLNIRCSSIFFYKYTTSVDQSKVKMNLGEEYDFRGTFSASGLVQFAQYSTTSKRSIFEDRMQGVFLTHS